MPAFHYCLLDGTSGQIDDIPATCTVAQIINELEQLHGTALHIVCVDERERATVYGRTGLKDMRLEIVRISKKAKSITAITEPSRPPLLLHKLPLVASTSRGWWCLCIRPLPKVRWQASEEDEMLVMFLIIGLVHRKVISALARGKRGTALALITRQFVEKMLVYDYGMCFIGLGGIPFGWHDPSITRVSLWRDMLAKTLNWACMQPRHLVDPSWSCYSTEFPISIDDPEQFLWGLSQLRGEVFGGPQAPQEMGSGAAWRMGRAKLPPIR